MAITKFQNTVMYSQLQPWSIVGANPSLDQITGSPVPQRIGILYKTTKPHPWRPTLRCEFINVAPLYERPITNQFLNPHFTPSAMSGFERNPQHSARAALYTRYTDEQWSNNLKSEYKTSDLNRDYSERLRNDIFRLLREIDDQKQNRCCLGERVNRVPFCHDELNDELKKLTVQISSIKSLKYDLVKEVNDIQCTINILNSKLEEAEAQHQQLLKLKSDLDNDYKQKGDTLVMIMKNV